MLIERVIELEDKYLHVNNPSRSRTDHNRLAKRPFDADEPSDHDGTPPRKIPRRYSQFLPSSHFPQQPRHIPPMHTLHTESARRSTPPLSPADRGIQNSEAAHVISFDPRVNERHLPIPYTPLPPLHDSPQAASSSSHTKSPLPDARWGHLQSENRSPPALRQSTTPRLPPTTTARVLPKPLSVTSQREEVSVFISNPGSLRDTFSRALSPSPFQANVAASELSPTHLPTSSQTSEYSRRGSRASSHSSNTDSRMTFSAQYERTKEHVVAGRLDKRLSPSEESRPHQVPKAERSPSFTVPLPGEGSESGKPLSLTSSPPLLHPASWSPASSMPPPTDTARLLLSRALSPSPFCP